MEIPVSVVIPFYKEGHRLDQTIQSVLSQTFQDFEMILVDNNATEDTRTVAQSYFRSYPERIRLIVEPEQGACSARNTGILQARGEFIAFIDGDDLMKPERLQRQHALLSSRPDLVLVSCHHDLLSHDGSKVLKSNRPDFGYGSQNMLEWKEYLHRLLRPFHLPHYSSFDLFGATFMFFRKKDAIKVGLFDPVFNPRDLEDFEFCMRMFELGGFCHLPESLQYYRDESPVTRKNKIKDKHTRERMARVQTFMEILRRRYVQPYPDNIDAFRSLTAFHLISFGTHLMQFSKGKRIGKSFIRRALKTNPRDLRNWKWYFKTWMPRFTHKRLFEFDQEKIDNLNFDKQFAQQFLRWP